ncbi:MAG: substrate-binding domain-containing protein [Clostridiales bacterium]|nr:substrate-binding domain-containing protein [Clostridiales bacterium]MCI6269404.1 substrate-binding domain-containing protein [Clostridiales bacterium]
MKRILSVLVALTLVFALCASASAETVEEALAAAAGMTNEELYEKAKEEMANGAQLNFYSTTSFAEKAAANFMAAYPELDGKVVYAEIDDVETYTILTSTIGSGVENSADMALTQNGADLKTYLLDEGLSYSYFPAALTGDVEEINQNPAVVTFINSLMIYHNGNGSINFTNVWELTEEQWKDKIFFKDPTNETVNINFLIMLTSEEWTERLAKAYEARYGKAWEAGEFTSPAYQWIDGFLKNVNYTYTSASKMAAGVASGAPGNMGLFVFSKLRKVDEADRKNLTVLQFENEVDCFSGFMYAVYATVCKDTECPYTCALFINYLLSEEGFAGEKSWNSSQGYYSPNKTIQKPEGLEDQPYEYWTDKLVFEDLQYIYDHYIDVYEFIATRVG